ncbi:hypothetical protein GCM10025782_07320 [Pedococcus ginsenosidimutans]|uniref:Uncharacterized protein n=1 Tax=Pedococcus ginsenosidimutans TaxID=490570 RepID=A0ABP8XTK6_9MICO
MTDIQGAGDLAVRFRNAIEAAATEGRLESHHFDNFPRGACGPSARILGQYLQDRGFSVWDYRSGVDADGQTHAWVEQEGWIIDITACQFEDVDEAVVVTKDDSWHRRFARMASYPYADLSADGPALRRDYRLLVTEADALD